MIEQYLQKLGITELNKMQSAAIEAARKQPEITLLSPTGSGKTLAYLLPLLERLKSGGNSIQAVIVSPTRELALQIEQVWKALGTGYKVSTFYGGHSFKAETDTLQNPPALLIGTPGRLLDHLTKGSFDGRNIRSLILDEFDKCLELGFESEVSALLRNLPDIKNIMLSSATNISKLPAVLAGKSFYVLDFLKKDNPKLTQKIVRAEAQDKLEALYKLICQLGKKQSLVFCNHRDAVERISEILTEKGLAHSIYHGKLEQEERELAIVKFRNGSSRVLIATDLAARGLDIPDIETVIHYQLPKTEDAFIHRNGRTARMHATGVSYLVLAQNEHLPSFINKKTQVESLKEGIEPANASEWTTLKLSAGKRDKVSKVDIVGLFIKKGNLSSGDLGLIEVKDDVSYVAVTPSAAKTLVSKLKDERIKKVKVRISLA